MNPRAVTYRRLHEIPADWGTAVNVQAMVFGNMGDRLRDRRGLHAQPLDRRQRVLRRVPGKCPRRRRRGWYPHSAAFDACRQEGEPIGFAGNGRGHA